MVLKKKSFEYFSMYFYGSNLGPPGPGPSLTLGRSFEQTLLTLGNATYLSQVVLKKMIFEYIFMHVYGSNLGLGSLARSYLELWDHRFDKHGKGPLGNASYQI